MKRMLFNATQQEELRVAIVDGQKLIDIDIETTGREQRKGNIYKGVITRIEPSLEACFVNYGEDKHGFLPFKECAKQYFLESIVDMRSCIRIQDVLKEGQEIIVQVGKEERGNKGAALTTFISLAGRYLVLMPNNPRGGGVSRRIESDERQELRETIIQLKIPDGMSIIARTAGIGRSVEELQWDLNYLLQLWNAIDLAANSMNAPLLIYLESSLVIRAIRDYFQPDIGEILIDTDDIDEQARTFIGIVMPDTLIKVRRYRDDVPLFSRFQIEHQIETAYARTVLLPSGGAIIFDHTEALVAIDVNSARSTKGSDIEETALRTNLEAADEVARQMRLRDLGGLIVIDFIDMDSSKSQREVEQRLKDALRYDRARVQMGKISRFGLMELSRQRLRPALSEGSHITCPRCNGTGHIRDTESSALQVLRIIQEEAMKENTAVIHCQVPIEVTTFLLNEKRQEINKIEIRFKVGIILIPNKYLETPRYKLERIRHDDSRLSDQRSSYRMALEAAREIEAENNYYINRRRDEELKPRQEAAVQGITPLHPAPSQINLPIFPNNIFYSPKKIFFISIKSIFGQSIILSLINRMQLILNTIVSNYSLVLNRIKTNYRIQKNIENEYCSKKNFNKKSKNKNLTSNTNINHNYYNNKNKNCAIDNKSYQKNSISSINNSSTNKTTIRNKTYNDNYKEECKTIVQTKIQSTKKIIETQNITIPVKLKTESTNFNDNSNKNNIFIKSNKLKTTNNNISSLKKTEEQRNRRRSKNTVRKHDCNNENSETLTPKTKLNKNKNRAIHLSLQENLANQPILSINKHNSIMNVTVVAPQIKSNIKQTIIMKDIIEEKNSKEYSKITSIKTNYNLISIPIAPKTLVSNVLLIDNSSTIVNNTNNKLQNTKNTTIYSVNLDLLVNSLKPMLDAAGLIWISTDKIKLSQVQKTPELVKNNFPVIRSRYIKKINTNNFLSKKPIIQIETRKKVVDSKY